ncbi:type II secretion system protein [bacterium]|nr:type II secretion system protein [bacterium]
MKKAFTLAEVLITLGIIGVVAALTMPTLMSHINSEINKNKFKKLLSVLNQAVNLNQAKYEFNFKTVTSNCINYKTEKPDSVQSVCAILNDNLANAKVYRYSEYKLDNGKEYYHEFYYNGGRTSDSLLRSRDSALYFYQMSDGIVFAIYAPPNNTTSTSCTLNGKTIQEALNDENFVKYCIGWVDVNGLSGPNREVRCSDGKAHSTDIDTANCVVPNSNEYAGDVFPVAFFDQSVVPASAAAKYMLMK